MSVSTSAIRSLAAKYDGPNLITQTIPALCDEVDRLRAECERLDRLAYLRIRLPWRKREAAREQAALARAES